MLLLLCKDSGITEAIAGKSQLLQHILVRLIYLGDGYSRDAASTGVVSRFQVCKSKCTPGRLAASACGKAYLEED